MKEDGVRFPCVRSPQQDDVCFFHLGVGTGAAAGPENRRQTDDARRVSSSIAAVYVVRSDNRANELLCNVVQFVGRLGTTEHSEQPWIPPLDDAPQGMLDAVERFGPRRWTVGAVFTNQRLQ
jgi:hypothetical protein